MAQAGQEIAQAFRRTPKRQLAPWDRARLNFRALERFVVHAQRARHRRCRINDDHWRVAVRIDVDEAVDADVEAAFFTRLADGGSREAFTAVDVAAGEHP